MWRLKKWLGVLLSLAVVGQSMPVFAAGSSGMEEEALFGDIPSVMSVGFFKMSKIKAPGAVLVIPGSDIENGPMRTIGQIAQDYIPSGVLSSHEFAGPINFTVRGITGHTNYLYDGDQLTHRIASGIPNVIALPLLGDVNRIEVIQGPGAIVHGSGAISGLVNIIPKNGTDNPGMHSSVEYGEREHLYKGEAGYGKSVAPGKDFYVYGGLLEARGYHAGEDFGYFQSQQDGVFAYDEQVQHGTRSNGFPNPNYKFAGNMNWGGFNLTSLLYNVSMQPDSYSEAWFINSGTVNNDAFTVRPRYTWTFTPQESLQATASMGMYDEFVSPTDRLNGKNAPTGGSFTYGSFPKIGGSELHEQGDLLFKTTRLPMNSIAVGALWGTREFINGRFYLSKSNAPLDTPYESINGKWDETAYYAEDVIQPVDALTFSLGGRFDDVNYVNIESREHAFDGGDARGRVLKPQGQNHFSPRLAMSMEVNPQNVVKLSYQQGFRTADANMYRWWVPFDERARALGLPGLPELKPETMDSYELDVHNEMKDKVLAFDTSLYYNVHKDMLLWHSFFEGDGYLPAGGVNRVLSDTSLGSNVPWWMGSFVNSRGKIAVGGIELSTTWTPSRDTKVTGSYAYNRPMGINRLEAQEGWLPLGANGDPTTSSQWRDMPTHIVKLNLTQNIGKMVTAVVQGSYFDAVYGQQTEYGVNFGYTDVYGVAHPAGDTPFSPPKNPYTKPRFVFDTAFTFHLTDRLSAKLSGFNIFGNAVPPVPANATRPWGGNVGYDDPKYYAEVKYKI